MIATGDTCFRNHELARARARTRNACGRKVSGSRRRKLDKVVDKSPGAVKVGNG